MKKLKIISIILLLVFSISGCADEQNNVELPDKNESTVESDTNIDKFINITMSKPDKLNPLDFTDKSAVSAMGLIYDGLFYQDKNYNVKPKLVKEYKVASDSKSIDITLKDVKFHDGKTLTSEDVKATINYIKSSNGIYKSFVDNISDVTYSSDKKLTISLKESDPFVINSLMFPILSENQTAKEVAYKDFTIGNGMYKVKDFEENNYLYLVKNEDYYDEIPKNMTDVKIKVLSNSNARVTMVMSLDSDIMQLDLSELSKFQESAFKITKFEGREFEYAKFNYLKSYMKDVNFRKAIVSAIDRTRIYEESYIEEGAKVDFPLNSKSEYYNSDVAQLTYSKDKAKDFLAKVKFDKFAENQTSTQTNTNKNNNTTNKSSNTTSKSSNTTSGKQNETSNTNENSSGTNSNSNNNTNTSESSGANSGTTNNSNTESTNKRNTSTNIEMNTNKRTVSNINVLNISKTNVNEILKARTNPNETNTTNDTNNSTNTNNVTNTDSTNNTNNENNTNNNAEQNNQAESNTNNNNTTNSNTDTKDTKTTKPRTTVVKTKPIKSINDINLKIVVNKDKLERVKASNVISENLKAIGIKSEIVQLDEKDLKTAVEKGDYDILLTGWNFSNKPNTKEIIADSGYTNDKLNNYFSLLDKANSKSEIKNIYKDIQKNVTNNAAFISLVVKNDYLVMNARLDGKLEPNDFNIYNKIENVTLKNKEVQK
ncbi:MAG: ABC transporter substrate-binding protein [Clostridioides sp.]|jgi:ABC-type transport system substrate-binding protein|nr:ABC transporter substrate-binding protein [Clostridioides sp.]